MARRVNRMPTSDRRRRPRAKREMPRELTATTNVSEGIASPPVVILPFALMLAEVLTQHEALLVTLIEHGILDGEKLERFCSRYAEEHLPGARQRIVQALKSSLEDHDARHLLSLLSSAQYREGW
jgi:hypothetical protein